MHENIWLCLHGHVCRADFDVYVRTYARWGFFFPLLVNMNWSFSGEQAPGFATSTGQFGSFVPWELAYTQERAQPCWLICVCVCASVFMVQTSGPVVDRGDSPTLLLLTHAAWSNTPR